MKRRALYLPLPPVLLQQDGSTDEARFQRWASPSGPLESYLCTGGDEARVLDEICQLVQPAHEERLAVGGGELDPALVCARLRGTLERDHKKGSPGLVEELFERGGPQLETHVRCMIKHLYHGVTKPQRPYQLISAASRTPPHLTQDIA